MKKYIHSDYVKANIATELQNMSKERLESMVSQIAYVANNDSISKGEIVQEIRYILSKFSI